MRKDKEYGLVSGDEELRILRQLDKEAASLKTYTKLVVTHKANTRDFDFEEQYFYSDTFKLINMAKNESVYQSADGGLKVIILYRSVRQILNSCLDGLGISNIVIGRGGFLVLNDMKAGDIKQLFNIAYSAYISGAKERAGWREYEKESIRTNAKVK
ncbi:hypothetical protein [Weissella oryzae]|nr:hypothetical protein [Weissella oryzae]